MSRRYWEVGRAALALALLCVPVVVLAPEAHAQTKLPTTTTLIARLGMRNRATSHYNEVFQTRGRWTFPDVFWFDAGRSTYREIGVGFGVEVLHTPHFTLNQTYTLSLASGTAAHSARFLVPWTLLAFTPNPRLRAEAVYFPEIPLNESARIQHIFEREKFEYVFQHVKLGAGYGAYKYGDRAWQQKPFLTTTLRGGNRGDLEFWLQRIPGNHVQVMARYKVAIKSSK